METGDALLPSTCWGGDCHAARRRDTHAPSHPWDFSDRGVLVDPAGLVARVLGVQPDPSEIRGTALRISWLRDTFRDLPGHADDAIVQRYTRAYLFLLISGMLFGNNSGSHLQLIYLQLLDHDWDQIRGYSWGSACLAILYRQLCRASHRGAAEIGGPLIVLQLWAWKHIHVGRPGRPAVHRAGQWVVPRLTHAHGARGLPYYRDALDRLNEEQVMTWDPYLAHLVEAMPLHFLDYHAEWRVRTPMICFEVVESHLPDRVMRQFRLHQPIPLEYDTSIRLHDIDRRGKAETNWSQEHWRFIELWDQRLESVVAGHPFEGVMDPRDPYMVWYMQITRRFINPSYTPPSTHYHPAYDVICGLAGDVSAMVDALSDALAGIPTRAQVERVRDMGMDTLQRFVHGHLIQPRDDHGRRSFHSQFELGQMLLGLFRVLMVVGGGRKVWAGGGNARVLFGVF
ncbi:serine/threonine-protein phosphatase 7 long form homolog [Chenopodium quinoa]|uniref:serine/threonine-protein phosphatase 7 long form homolog n=1 Tax=Chenopodium quinoa TaxID=63459 RepID=UPI000B76CC6D|nr:serine/threonine-protein phosphatase 7 long form homolog [Chenopodium quinoa]